MRRIAYLWPIVVCGCSTAPWAGTLDHLSPSKARIGHRNPNDDIYGPPIPRTDPSLPPPPLAVPGPALPTGKPKSTPPPAPAPIPVDSSIDPFGRSSDVLPPAVVTEPPPRGSTMSR